MATLVFYLEDGTTLNHTLDEGTTTIGRHPDSVVVLEFASVSGHHAVIELNESGCFVSDLKSSNGTRVNGVEIEEAQLNDGDRVGFGDVQAVFVAGDVVDAPAPAAPPPPPEFMPAPEIRSPEAPPQIQRTNYRAPAPKRSSKVKTYDGGGSGCGTAIVVIGLFLAAMLAGLYMRHHKETNGGNFFEDLSGKLQTKLPKIKIEKKAGE